MKFAMSPRRDFLLGEREHSDLVAYVRLNGRLANVIREAAIIDGVSHPEIVRRALQHWVDHHPGAPAEVNLPQIRPPQMHLEPADKKKRARNFIRCFASETRK